MPPGLIKRIFLYRKSDDKKSARIRKIIGFTFIASLFWGAFSFTTYGADVYQAFVERYPETKFAPKLQWTVAKVHRTWREYPKAAEAFRKFYERYGNYNEDMTIEAEYQEITCLNTAKQFKTCWLRVDRFIMKYGSGDFDDPDEDPDRLEKLRGNPQFAEYYKNCKAFRRNFTAYPEKAYDHPWF